MDGLAADDPCYAFRPMDPDPLPQVDGAIVAAHRAKKEKSSLIDVMDNEADLIHVASQQNTDLSIFV
jgi:hypothetical protein